MMFGFGQHINSITFLRTCLLCFQKVGFHNSSKDDEHHSKRKANSSKLKFPTQCSVTWKMQVSENRARKLNNGQARLSRRWWTGCRRRWSAWRRPCGALPLCCCWGARTTLGGRQRPGSAQRYFFISYHWEVKKQGGHAPARPHRETDRQKHRKKLEQKVKT